MKTYQWVPIPQTEVDDAVEFNHTPWGGVENVVVKKGFAICKEVEVETGQTVDFSFLSAMTAVIVAARNGEQLSSADPAVAFCTGYLTGMLQELGATVPWSMDEVLR